jgi:hypothetical protein
VRSFKDTLHIVSHDTRPVEKTKLGAIEIATPHRRQPLQVHGAKKRRSTRKRHLRRNAAWHHDLVPCPVFMRAQNNIPTSDHTNTKSSYTYSTHTLQKLPQALPVPLASTTIPDRFFGAATPPGRYTGQVNSNQKFGSKIRSPESIGPVRNQLAGQNKVAPLKPSIAWTHLARPAPNRPVSPAPNGHLGFSNTGSQKWYFRLLVSAKRNHTRDSIEPTAEK